MINETTRVFDVSGTDTFLFVEYDKKSDNSFIYPVSKTKLSEYPLKKALVDGAIPYAGISLSMSLMMPEGSLLLLATVLLGYPIMIATALGLNKLTWKKKEFNEDDVDPEYEIFKNPSILPEVVAEGDFRTTLRKNVIETYLEAVAQNNSEKIVESTNQDRDFTSVFSDYAQIIDDKLKDSDSEEISENENTDESILKTLNI